MRTKPLILVAAITSAMAQTIVQTSVRDSSHVIEAAYPRGPISLQLRNFSVHLTYPKYGPEDGGISVLYDPASMYYAWIYAPDQGPDDPERSSTPGALFKKYESKQLAVAIRSDGMFTFDQHPREIRIKEWRGKAEGMGDASKKSIEEVRLRLPGSGGGPWPGLEEGHLVKLPASLGNEFYFPPMTPVEMWTTINRISYEDNHWIIVIENQWRQELVLDDNYSILSTKKLNEPMTPHSFKTNYGQQN